MQKLKLLLIAFGFFWIFAWSVFGSILGAKINLILATGANSSWLVGVQKNLLAAAHAHMNSMSIILILLALSLNQIKGFVSNRIIKIICLTNLISMPLFGMGLLFEAFYPSASGSLSIFTAVAALGAILYMLTIGIWSSFFIVSYTRL